MNPRTSELEWLLSATAETPDAIAAASSMPHLLAAAVDHIECAFGAILLPERQLDLTYESRSTIDADSVAAFRHALPFMTSYIQRHAQPLVVDTARLHGGTIPLCKIMALPIFGRTHVVSGLLAFIKPRAAPDFGQRQKVLGQQIARQVETLVGQEYDLATGLRSRSAVERAIVNLRREQFDKEAGTLVYMDIDRMRLINETCGFAVGDQIISRVAGVLGPPHFPGDAIIGRIGGDRFVVYLPQHDADQASRCCDSLQEQLSQFVVAAPGNEPGVSVSCGIVKLFSDFPTFSHCLAAAELACKSAKDNGRAQATIYLAPSDSMIRRRQDLLAARRLATAIEESRLVMFGQKIVGVRELDRPAGIECLVRVVEGDGVYLAPQTFICAAKRFDMLKELDRWVIRNTFETLRPFASSLFHWNVYVSINISGQSLQDEHFLADVESWLLESNVPPGLIMFEITETVAVANLDRAQALIHRLRQRGCRFALDDFGTGMNSLAYLKSLPVTCIKIDGSFIRDVLADKVSDALVRSMVRLAASLDIDCIAECIETPEVRSRLAELGVNYVQGHVAHVPEPLKKLLQTMKNEESQRVARLMFDL
jgi:diguanylate cyclase (GGDEF)-like protein